MAPLAPAHPLPVLPAIITATLIRQGIQACPGPAPVAPAQGRGLVTCPPRRQVDGDAEGADERRAALRFGKAAALRLSFRSLVRVDNLQGLTSLATLQLDNNALTRLENLDHLVRARAAAATLPALPAARCAGAGLLRPPGPSQRRRTVQPYGWDCVVRRSTWLCACPSLSRAHGPAHGVLDKLGSAGAEPAGQTRRALCWSGTCAAQQHCCAAAAHRSAEQGSGARPHCCPGSALHGCDARPRTARQPHRAAAVLDGGGAWWRSLTCASPHQRRGCSMRRS